MAELCKFNTCYINTYSSKLFLRRDQLWSNRAKTASNFDAEFMETNLQLSRLFFVFACGWFLSQSKLRSKHSAFSSASASIVIIDMNPIPPEKEALSAKQSALVCIYKYRVACNFWRSSSHTTKQYDGSLSNFTVLPRPRMPRSSLSSTRCELAKAKNMPSWGNHF